MRLRRGENPLKVTPILRTYQVGERVVIDINPSIHKGMPHKRFHGKVGVVLERRGRAYVLKVGVGGKDKIVIARPEHLKPLAQ